MNLENHSLLSPAPSVVLSAVVFVEWLVPGRLKGRLFLASLILNRLLTLLSRAHLSLSLASSSFSYSSSAIRSASTYGELLKATSGVSGARAAPFLIGVDGSDVPFFDFGLFEG